MIIEVSWIMLAVFIATLLALEWRRSGGDTNLQVDTMEVRSIETEHCADCGDAATCMQSTPTGPQYYCKACCGWCNNE